jgi:predicted DNA-binding transcriptional regulator YafY
MLRQWSMLRYVPREPRKVDAATLERKLLEEGFQVTRRTIQRGLTDLARVFPLVADDRSKPYGWSFSRDAGTFELPAMDTATALGLSMAEAFLGPLLPRGVLKALDGHFGRARAVLDAAGDGPAAAWRERVRVVPQALQMAPAETRAGVLEVAGEALYLSRRLQVRYRKRGAAEAREMEVSPLALVFHAGVLYLVVTSEPRLSAFQLAVHRIEEARVLDREAIALPGFDVDAWIREGNLGVLWSAAPERLVARVAEPLSQILAETPLAADQSLAAIGDGWHRLTATVALSQKLRGWLLSYGSFVVVEEPDALRKELGSEAAALAAMYAPAPARDAG